MRARRLIAWAAFLLALAQPVTAGAVAVAALDGLRARLCCAERCAHGRLASCPSGCCQVGAADDQRATVSRPGLTLNPSTHSVSAMSDTPYHDPRSPEAPSAPREVFRRPAPIFLLTLSLRL